MAENNTEKKPRNVLFHNNFFFVQRRSQKFQRTLTIGNRVIRFFVCFFFSLLLSGLLHYFVSVRPKTKIKRFHSWAARQVNNVAFVSVANGLIKMPENVREIMEMDFSLFGIHIKSLQN